MDAAAVIREARQQAGLTQTALAKAAGTSQPALAAYESGARSPSVRTLDKIVRAAGYTCQMILMPAAPAHGRTLAWVRSHQHEIRQAAQRRGVRNVRVFGSVARGDDSGDSDVDLLVDFDAAARGLLPLVSFIDDAERILGRPVDASTPALLSDAVRERALLEAVPL